VSEESTGRKSQPGRVLISGTLLTRSYGDPEVALNTGMILKEMLRYEPLAKNLLYSEQ
jgi:hypothetical protein